MNAHTESTTTADLACSYGCGRVADCVILPTADAPAPDPRCSDCLDTFRDVVTVGDRSSSTYVLQSWRAVDDGTDPAAADVTARVAAALDSAADDVVSADGPDAELAQDVTALIDGAREHGGASVRVGAEDVEHGYLVGIDGRGIVFDSLDDVDRAAVAEWVAVAGHLEHAAALGSWIDGRTGRVYFDASSHHAELAEALTVAAIRGELAIWDVTGAREIQADGTVRAADVVPGDVVEFPVRAAIVTTSTTNDAGTHVQLTRSTEVGQRYWGLDAERRVKLSH